MFALAFHEVFLNNLYGFVNVDAPLVFLKGPSLGARVHMFMCVSVRVSMCLSAGVCRCM